MGTRLGRLNEIPQRLKKFITHDVRKNPILGLYLVIGVMVVGYGIYFIAVMYKDLTGGGEKRVPTKPKVARVEKTPAPSKEVPAKREATEPVAQKETPEQTKQAQKVSEVKKVAEKPKPTAAEKLDISQWKSFEFGDGSRISFPADWSKSEVDSEDSTLQGIRLQLPGSSASFKCYSRSRRLGDDYAKSLKETMRKGGYTEIKEQTQKIKQREVVKISGSLADKNMAVSIFEHQPDKYFIVRLIASKREFDKLGPYYSAIVDSYGDKATSSTSAVSIEKLEQQLEKGIEKKEDYLVGSTVWIKLKNGARHKGVVIAEDDSSLTLESFRFGGRYSFTVKKEDIEEIIR